MEFVGDLPLIAHNALFDIGFLNHNLTYLGKEIITNQIIDTIELSHIYISRAYNYKLETLKYYFKLNYRSHRSIEDCKTTNYIYQKCKRVIELIS